MQRVYYTEALIKKLPLDYSLYSEVLTRLVAVTHYEHALIYLEPLAQQIPDGPRLRQLAAFQRELGNRFFDEGDDEGRDTSRNLLRERNNSKAIVTSE